MDTNDHKQKRRPSRTKKKARPGGAGLALKRDHNRPLLKAIEYARFVLTLLKLAVQIGTLLAHHP